MVSTVEHTSDLYHNIHRTEAIRSQQLNPITYDLYDNIHRTEVSHNAVASRTEAWDDGASENIRERVGGVNGEREM